MSKIQEALKRIQSSKPVPKRNKRPEPIASVQTEVPDQTAETSGDPERYVGVDRDLLQHAGLLAPEDQARHMADQYRLIKRPILDLAKGQSADTPDHANLVMVASALPGDGKTFNAINIALSMAVEKDTSVLLVDADVPKPHISNLFGIAEETGLIDLLANESLNLADAIMATDVPGLSILPAGRSNEHATELLASDRMANIAHELSATNPNRIVVFDSPPLLATSESRVLSSRMGQIVLVVCADKTPHGAVRDAIESLDQNKPINLVLNQVGTSMTDGLYGNYQYGYGYHTESVSE